MYIPAFTAIAPEQARTIVQNVGSGWLVTNSAEAAPAATLMPILWRDDVVIAHMAKANPHWRAITDGSPALLIVGGPESYISPSWYPTKAEHGKVVPTWNYVAVHLTGTIHIHRDPQWLLNAVAALTDQHEQSRTEPWHVSDAPDDYIANQLKAIIGIELRVGTVEGKAKLSQNRSNTDQMGVIDGLQEQIDDHQATAIALAMQHARRSELEA